MPINKNALLRHQIIDKCLRNRMRKWGWKELLDKVNEVLNEEGVKGINKTQIYSDLADIEINIYKAPLAREFVGRKTYFSYSDPKYSISNTPLTEQEAKQLKSAMMVLTRFTGLPQFEWVNEIVPLLEHKMGLVPFEKEIISFENNHNYIGLTYIPLLFKAVADKKVLKIIYQDFKSLLEYPVELHPYHIKQYKNRWFVLGYNPQYPDKIQTLALDRIKNTEETNSKYKEDVINWNDYFNNIIGVTKLDGEPVEIKLLIKDAEQVAYIKTKPLHNTQTEIIPVEGCYQTSIKVIPNYELQSLILSFGERVEVAEPLFLREQITFRVKNTSKLYTDAATGNK